MNVWQYYFCSSGEKVRRNNRKKLFNAIWSGYETDLSNEISKYLKQTISTYDFRGHFYHAFLAGSFPVPDISSDSTGNREMADRTSSSWTGIPAMQLFLS